MNDTLLTLPEVAARLRVPLPTLYTWRSRGVGPPALRIVGHVRVRASELERWIDSRRETASPPTSRDG